MTKQIIRDPITGYTKQPLGRVALGGSLFFCLFGSMAVFMPNYAGNLVLAALTLAIAGTITIIWLNIKPNLWLKFLNYTSIAGLWVIISIRVFAYLLPNWSVISGVVILLTVVFAHVLPIINPKITGFLRGELSFSPKTRAGRFILKGSLLIMPIAGFIGAAIGLFLNEGDGKVSIAVLIAGPLFWALAIILPFSTIHPASPWERKV